VKEQGRGERDEGRGRKTAAPVNLLSLSPPAGEGLGRGAKTAAQVMHLSPSPLAGEGLGRGGATLRPTLGAERMRLADGRWRFRHGPIDLVIGADGDVASVSRATEKAWNRFESILAELVTELRWLRLPVQEANAVRGKVARRMVDATLPHCERFITPMAAVAGAVADELIELFRNERFIERAHVNNGGDIALHLAPGSVYRVGMLADIESAKHREKTSLDGAFEVTHDSAVRGVATSGWRGRSHNMGIADAVTALANSAAAADAAATLIANDVNLEDPAILRRPANMLKDDTDLGERLVTIGVGELSSEQINMALDAGERTARTMREAGQIYAATLWLQGSARVLVPGTLKDCR
jgi:uncharacterized protein